MDVLTDVRKDVPGSMMFADDIVLCGDDETDMTKYLETWTRALEDRGMRISKPKNQFIDIQFGEDNGQGRGPVKILGEELQRVYHFRKNNGLSTESAANELNEFYARFDKYDFSQEQEKLHSELILKAKDCDHMEGRKEGTCFFDINIKHNTEIYIGKIISGDSH